MKFLLLLPLFFVASLRGMDETTAKDGASLRGITISCQGWGRIWGQDQFARELPRLVALGANAVATHPYAAIRADGTVAFREWPADAPPDYIARPVREARELGIQSMIKPHLAYWGSPFSWRGAIAFEEESQRRRFFDTYRRWIVAVAAATSDADIFVVGTELDQFGRYEAEWRDIIAAVRSVTKARLTYAANWDGYERIPFWDALDLVGIQAYFPLSEEEDPDRAALAQGWTKVFGRLEKFHQSTGKPIFFTELGYNRSLRAAAQPWHHVQQSGHAAAGLQERCLRIGLEWTAGREAALWRRRYPWFRGVFLWKWFVGPAGGENFYLNEARLRTIIQSVWLGSGPRGGPSERGGE
ncbi:hypothetical protein SCOR_12640 [Sulfidibacter corallicola]|uniref:GTA TIM-barrel-like domain-containing protein n=1 Tax=Sulfidibacter corallicola TaxID=2818388 RepID=A0A8A4TF43_SULCO|nr:hypothetical protein [Sulfidibacter corallicola]QTD47824.1 hypothetical protein J3U87_19730 [Sulfidibacter corallicola]